jgi:hypothetical protein
MQKVNKIFLPLKDNGAVLPIVIIVLIVTMLICVFVVKAVFMGTRIARNHVEYEQDLSIAEGAGDYVHSIFDTIVKAQPLYINTPITNIENQLPTIQIPKMESGANLRNKSTVSLEYTKTGPPPPGSGMGVAGTNVNYYKITSQSNLKNTGLKVNIGVWKAFPSKR